MRRWSSSLLWTAPRVLSHPDGKVISLDETEAEPVTVVAPVNLTMTAEALFGAA